MYHRHWCSYSVAAILNIIYCWIKMSQCGRATLCWQNYNVLIFMPWGCRCPFLLHREKWSYFLVIMPKGIMFLTKTTLSLCVCVCLSVIMFAARWLDLATWYQVKSILSTRTWKCNPSQDDPFPFPFHMDHPYKITFWPVTSKLMDGLTPNFICL